MVGCLVAAVHLLAQEMKHGLSIGTCLIGIQLNVIIVNGVGCKETDHGTRAQPLLTDDFLEHGPGIVKQTACLFTNHFILEYPRELAGQFPGLEEWTPVNVVDQLGQRVIIKYPDTQKCGFGRLIVLPVCRELVGTRLDQAGEFAVLLLSGTLFTQLPVFFLGLGNVGLAPVFA